MPSTFTSGVDAIHPIRVFFYPELWLLERKNIFGMRFFGMFKPRVGKDVPPEVAEGRPL